MTDPVQPSEWVGRQLKELRKRRGYTGKELAALCAEHGFPHLTEAVIVNLETRRRRKASGRPGREITVDELVMLAYVLDAPPAALLVPLDGRERLAITPGVDMGSLHALEWVSGEYPPPDYGSERRMAWRGASAPITLYREFRKAARAAMHADIEDPPPGPEDEKRLAARLADLATVVKLMVGSGITPPALPGRWVRVMVADGHLDDAADVPISDEGDGQ